MNKYITKKQTFNGSKQWTIEATVLFNYLDSWNKNTAGILYKGTSRDIIYNNIYRNIKNEDCTEMEAVTKK
jgi:hypothetical protein